MNKDVYFKKENDVNQEERTPLPKGMYTPRIYWCGFFLFRESK